MVKRIWDWLRDIFPKFVRYYNRFEIRGLENLPNKGSAIIAPNHSGAFDLDNFCIMSALEQFKITNPARKRIWLCYWDTWSIGDNTWAKWVQKFSPLPISVTGGGIPWNIADQIVKRGELIAIMPEGHSAALYEGYRLWKFYPGVIKLHLKYQVPIIPTASIGFVSSAPWLSNVYNPQKVPPWEREIPLPFILPGKLIFHFGKPLMFKEYFNKDIDRETLYTLANKVRSKVAEILSLYRKGVSWNNPYGKKINKMYKKSYKNISK